MMRAAVVHDFPKPLRIEERAPVDLAETFELHAHGRTRVVRETRQLENVNECFHDVLSGSVDARLVFDMR